MHFLSTRGRRRGAIPAVLLAATLVGCETPAEVHDHDGPVFGTESAQARSGAAALPALAKRVRQETARYHSTVQAVKAGYAPTPDCVAVPGLGGMGFHWANFGLVDTDFDPARPEVVLYEPDAKGKPHLVAVEYIVRNEGQDAPTFDGQPFDVGGTPVPGPHWSLHVWLHKENPNGLFTPFNPNVSCAGA